MHVRHARVVASSAAVFAGGGPVLAFECVGGGELGCVADSSCDGAQRRIGLVEKLGGGGHPRGMRQLAPLERPRPGAAPRPLREQPAGLGERADHPNADPVPPNWANKSVTARWACPSGSLTTVWS
jgi:hypothetical protein